MHTGLTRRPLAVVPTCPACTTATAPATAVPDGVLPGAVAICSGCTMAHLVGPEGTLRRLTSGLVFALVLEGTWDDVEMVQRVFRRRIEVEQRKERLL